MLVPFSSHFCPDPETLIVGSLPLTGFVLMPYHCQAGKKLRHPDRESPQQNVPA